MPWNISYYFVPSAFLGQGFGYSKLYVFHVFLTLALIFILKKYKLNFRLHQVHSLIPWFIIGVYSVVSLSWSVDISYGIIENIHLWMGILLLVSVMYLDIDRSKMVKGIMVILWINLVISLGESFGLFRYPFSQFSELAYLFKRDNNNLLEIQKWHPIKIDWPTGFHWNSNNNGLFVLFTFPLFVRENSYRMSTLYYILASWVVFMALSKLIFVGWIIMTLIMMTYVTITLNFKRRLIVLSGIGMAVVIGLVYLFNANPYRTEKYSKTVMTITSFASHLPDIFIARLKNSNVNFNFLRFDISLHERLTYTDGLMKVISKNFFFGVGAGGLSKLEHIVADHRVYLKTPHFYLLEIFAKYGVFIFGIYIYWVVNLFLKAFRMSKLMALSLIMLFLFSMIPSSLSYFLPMWGFFAYLLIDLKSSWGSQKV